MEPVQRQASLSEPTYTLYPTLPQDLNRIRHISQNQNTVEVNRQIIHPRRNRNSQTPRVTCNIPQSPTPSISEVSSITLPDTPTLTSQQNTTNLPSDYLGSTPTSEQIRENPFNPPPPPQQHRTTTILDNPTLITRRTKLSKGTDRYFLRYNIINPPRNVITPLNAINKSNITIIFPPKFSK